MLCVKLTRSNVIVYGRNGILSRRLHFHIIVFCFFRRLLEMKLERNWFMIQCATCIPKDVRVWISKAYELSLSYDFDIDSCTCTQLTYGQFELICHGCIMSYLVFTGLYALHSDDKSIVGTYRSFTFSFTTRCYLECSNVVLRNSCLIYLISEPIHMTSKKKLIFVMICRDSHPFTLLGKFVHQSFSNQNMLRHIVRKY